MDWKSKGKALHLGPEILGDLLEGLLVVVNTKDAFSFKWGLF